MSRKLLSFILIVFLLSFALPVSAAPTSVSLPIYTGAHPTSGTGASLQFQDIAGHWANPSILRTCAVSLLRGQTPNTFAPQLNTSYSDALVLAVRLKGLETAAQTEGEKLALATSHPLTITAEAKWLEGYLTIAKKNGILTESEYADIMVLSAEATAANNEAASQLVEQALNSGDITANQASRVRYDVNSALSLNRAWNVSVSRQQALIWIARALEFRPIYGSDQQKIYILRDWQRLNPEYIPLIEAALQAGIISGSNQGYLNPSQAITRGELASIADRAFPLAAERLGYKLQTAWIDKIEYLYTPVASNSGFTYEVGLQLQNIDGTYVQVYATSQNNSSGSPTGSFPIYKQGQPINPTLLAEGWELQYITFGQTIIWMEVL